MHANQYPLAITVASRPKPAGATVPRTRPKSSGPGWKRSMDFTLVAIALPVVLIAIAVAAFWVKSVSRGPVLFRQERVGRGGRRFMMYKLRSMAVSADSNPHRSHIRKLAGSQRPMTKLDQLGDTRLIPGGRFLRSTCLDELPQLLNVLKGDMSLVGPRPCLPYEFDLYPERQRARFGVRPGLTGLWQVNGKNLVSFREMRAMDAYYSKKVSFRLDLAILSKTPVAVGRQVWDDLGDCRKRLAAGMTRMKEPQPFWRAVKSE